LASYLIIFGAAVRLDGKPSGTLRRRIDGALAAAAGCEDAWFLPTGGLGREGFVEAQVMADRLRAGGAPSARIVIEGQARDTFESARLCDRLLSERGDVDEVLICTSRFHQPRCALLFAMLGYRVRRPPMPRDLPAVGLGRWLRYVAKEFVSTPYDAALMLGHLAFGRRRLG
jgi:uncharacterized SAM-binding protein YcdF (DUF218 family)